MLRRRRVSVYAIIYLVLIAVLSNFFLMPSQGISDGIPGWPVGQSVSNDSLADSLTSATAPTTEPQTEESNVSFLTLLWEMINVLL